jgi:hypothetical protein
MFEPRAEEPVTTAVGARSRLRRLQAERLDAAEAGLGANAVYMADLHADITAARVAYVGLAMTEVATLRAELGGTQVG